MIVGARSRYALCDKHPIRHAYSAKVFDNHLDVSESERTAPGIGLPSANEIPNIDIEVINYHRPVLGTFHAKFMVVDRKIAIVCSNNIQVSSLVPQDL